MHNNGMHFRKLVAMSATALCLGACMDETLETDEDVAYAMTLNAMTLNAMGQASTTGKGKLLADKPLGQNPDAAALAVDVPGVNISPGQELLKYTARCALEAGEKLIIKDTNGKVHSWPGTLGLLSKMAGAKLGLDWRKAALPAEGARWWMACMLAHVNAFQTPVEISLRGPHPALENPSAAEKALFPYDEGSFWGDFGEASDDSSVERMYACFREELYLECESRFPGQGEARAIHTIHQRVCARGGCDNFQVVGPCTNFLGNGKYACSTEIDGWVTDCHTALSTSEGKWPASSTAYAEVTSSNLKKLTCSDSPD